MAEPTDVSPHARRVVFVVGSGRSGTSLISTCLQTLGMHVPQPEIKANESNPKGHGEPRWVVKRHKKLLESCHIRGFDMRPQAWDDAENLYESEELQAQLQRWLESQFEAGGPELVIKDPRLAWFMPLWAAATARADASAACITMLRPVTEVVGSKQKYYSTQFSEAKQTAGWVNMMLNTERVTRDLPRAFVSYHDMLTDWTAPVFALGETFSLHSVQSASEDAINAAHALVDPGLHRVRLTWEDIVVPTRLREIADETWQQLSSLSIPGDETVIRTTLDELRAAYADLYESMRDGDELSRPKAASPTHAGSRRMVDRIPRSWRARIPERLRRRLRTLVRRDR